MYRPTFRLLFVIIFLISIITVLFSPVHNLIIKSDELSLLSLPVSSVNTFHTGYIHSVQLTPVEDDYKIIDSSIWLWEERVVSHNAGLPVDAPRNGRFFQDKNWMYVQGGRYNSQKYFLRVGNSTLGKNWLKISPFAKINLFEHFPSKLLEIEVTETPLIISIYEKQETLLQKGIRHNTINSK